MTGFGAPAAGFGKAPAAGFGAAGGFGAPAAPAAGGFGKAPAAAGGFGAPPAAAAGGFGAGGFGAAAPAAGGFGKAPAAAGGFGAAAPAAGGFGAPAAAGGFGAPAAGGFGAAAPPAAGGFGKAPVGGFGGGGFGAAAPAAGGFGKAPMGGFGVGAAPPAPTLLYQGVTGPGYVPPNTPSWLSGVDTSLITDDTVIANSPAALQQHLGILLEFGETERQAKTQLDELYRDLHSHNNPKGLRALQNRLEQLQIAGGGVGGAGADSAPSTHGAAGSTKGASGGGTSKPTPPALPFGLEGLLVLVDHRDASLNDLQRQTKELEALVAEYQRTVVERVVRDAADGFPELKQSSNKQDHHHQRRREPTSPLVEQSLSRLVQLMESLDDTLNDLCIAVGSVQPGAIATRCTRVKNAVAGAAAAAATGGAASANGSSVTGGSAGGPLSGGTSSAENPNGLFGVGAAYAQRNTHYADPTVAASPTNAAGTAPDLRQLVLQSAVSSSRDPVATVNDGLQESLQTFLAVGRRVAEVHARADLVRDHVTRYYGPSEAEALFGRNDAAMPWQMGEGQSVYVAEGVRPSFGTVGETLRGGMTSRGRLGQGATGSSLGGGKKLRMQYDPSKQAQQGNVGTAPAGAVPSAAVGGFGAPPAAAAASKGFGAAPAAGGFGAPAAAPAAGGFGAAAAPATAGFGAAAPAAAPSAGFGAAPAAPAAATTGFGASAAAPAAAAPPTVGFGANVGTPAGAPLTSTATGLGATPAPAGFGAVATPASAAHGGGGQTPSVPTPSLPGFSPSPAGVIAVDGTPSPAVNTPGDDRPRKKQR